MFLIAFHVINQGHIPVHMCAHTQNEGTRECVTASTFYKSETPDLETPQLS